MTPEELRAAVDYLDACIRDIHTTAEGRALDVDEQTRFDDGLAERARLVELIERHNTVARLAQNPANVIAGASFDAPALNTRASDDPFDLSELRFNTPASEIRARALTAIERTPGMTDDMRESSTDLVQRIDNPRGDLARHILATGSEAYRSAFSKYLAGAEYTMTEDEKRAVTEARVASLGGTVGYVVPYTLDPTIILTNAGTANPIRAISTVKQIISKTWHGVTSAGVTASYGAESAVVADGAPTLVQPTISAEKAQAFVPFTIEAGEDWQNLESDVRMMIVDAKDRLEATKFTLGAGSGSNEPKGIVTAVAAVGGSVVSPITAETLAVGDVYALEAALPPRHRGNSSFLANKAIFQKIRQFDTSNGNALWVRVGAGQPAQLLGYNAYECSDMDGAYDPAVVAAHNYLMLMGDFKNFVIVDRVGLNVELVPMLFDTATGRPTGQRGIYAHWRSGSDVVNADAFRLFDMPTS